ncbi:DUF6456 domain-containing protein [Actibacterium sp. 188UL27-1]|uniref:DUF6456 domain-containing protein n=1 Tax=Actibacterium sp. 188UL27-1 TaxID=2786961 RepID=UPI00195900A8|nr:DUF6456 domain-containing protein [Actibacterium sp. 188UL27-1]MBM7068486.1 helix-turn-helix domain-containing protein [Actibacterium sp. 188UL27-1]
MEMGKQRVQSVGAVPPWVPTEALHYLRHTEQGLSIRAVARDEGCHASTILRQIRRFEQRRDDPLIDEALSNLGASHFQSDIATASDLRGRDMQAARKRDVSPVCDADTINREARRILRRLSETGAMLVVAPELQKAAVLRELPDGRSTRTGVVTREVAQAFALKDWIACQRSGKIATYKITAAGRAALKRLLAEQSKVAAGFSEDQSAFAAQHRDWDEKEVPEEGCGKTRRVRYNIAESPIVTLARRRDKDGKPFLEGELVAAAERLREDFELAQMAPRVTQNWEGFLTAGTRSGFGGGDAGGGPQAARDRVASALKDLGPGLGDMVLRCCCFLEGLEMTEKRMGWSARSGKVVLRIALQRLKRHYDESYGPGGGMIG